MGAGGAARPLSDVRRGSPKPLGPTGGGRSHRSPARRPPGGPGGGLPAARPRARRGGTAPGDGLLIVGICPAALDVTARTEPARIVHPDPDRAARRTGRQEEHLRLPRRPGAGPGTADPRGAGTRSGVLPRAYRLLKSGPCVLVRLIS